MILREIVHEASGVVRAFDQVLVFSLHMPSRGGEIAVENRHHVSGQETACRA